MGFNIVANHYGETIKALMEDEHIKAMAEEIMTCGHPPSEMTNDDGDPKFSFMRKALDEYHARGGQIGTHIGGPAHAIIRILKNAEQSKEG